MKAACAFLYLLLLTPLAHAEICDHSKKYCGYLSGSGGGPRSTGAPSRGSKIRINPSAVPTEKGLGIESIIFDGADFSLVKGMGRVGAGISPSASESTFFGPPALENSDDYLERRLNLQKFESKKVTLATAFELYQNKKGGMKAFDVRLGVMGKYNQLTKAVTGGGGLSGVIGPFTYGYALYSDQTQLEDPVTSQKSVTKYTVQTLSGGIFLYSLALDYSSLRMVTDVPNAEPMTVNTFTASLLLNRVILTAAMRTETSDLPDYNPQTKMLEVARTKRDVFFGGQFGLGKHLMLGAFYNYYLLDEVSLGVTLFF